MKKGAYRHYKGEVYQVINTARHSETEESFVVYHNIKTPDELWIRPFTMFNETIEINGSPVKRFEFMNADV